jgi:hypothetical protein
MDKDLAERERENKRTKKKIQMRLCVFHLICNAMDMQLNSKIRTKSGILLSLNILSNQPVTVEVNFVEVRSSI